MTLRSLTLVSSLLAATFLPSAHAAPAGAPDPGIEAAGSRDFDFLRGHWYVSNKRLLKQLQGSREWTSSTGTLVGAPLLEGMGNYDELRSDDTGPLGVSIRFHDRRTGQWSDYWIAHRDGVLQPAVSGAFADGVGTFEGDDMLHGKPIRVRQLWTGIDTATPRWEQAFSGDDGRTWETNWVMDFSRTPVR